jgi:gamma-glutamyltranspeptidase/glutathione hydrolase
MPYQFLSPETTRPAIYGRQHMVSTNHYLATQAALGILEMGGNAIDAGVAAGLVINVVQPDETSLGGIVPIIVHEGSSRRTYALCGVGPWSSAVHPEEFARMGEIPQGPMSVVVPAAIDAWVLALQRAGRLTFAQVAAPAIELAEGGYIVDRFLAANLGAEAETLRQWPSSAAIFLPGGRPPARGDPLVQSDLARTLLELVRVERASKWKGRGSALQAIRDNFYRGAWAHEIVHAVNAWGGYLTVDDLASFQVRIEEPVKGHFADMDLCVCGPWCQGPVILQTLEILSGFELHSLEHNHAEYLHVLVEALKLVFADRERFYGDPDYVNIPLEGLLSPTYAARRRALIDIARAAPGMPPAGDPWGETRSEDPRVAAPSLPANGARRRAGGPDTSYVAVIDCDGNAFSATPSDSSLIAPVVPGLGFVPSTRGAQSRPDVAHPAACLPGRRPRVTPTPLLGIKDGEAVLALGTPGGDAQPQALVQFLLNQLKFGLDPQAAVEAPRVISASFPQSFSPYTYLPGLLQVEGRIPGAICEALSNRGHRIEMWPDWYTAAGCVCAVLRDPSRGVFVGAADPRRLSFALGR